MKFSTRPKARCIYKYPRPRHFTEWPAVLPALAGPSHWHGAGGRLIHHHHQNSTERSHNRNGIAGQSQHTTHRALCGPPEKHGRAFCDRAVISFGSSHSPTNSTSLSRTHIYTRGVRNNRAGLEFDQLHHEIRSLWFHTHNAVTKLLEVIAKQRFGEVVSKVVLRP